MEYKDRKKDILDILYANGRVSVSKLAKTLFVSEMTIRRDLSEMEKDGALDFGGLFVFLGVKNTTLSPLHLFLNLLDLNLRLYANILTSWGFCDIIDKLIYI